MKKEFYKKVKNLITKKERVAIEAINTENLERIFPIEVVASTFENRLLTDYNKLQEFWCFITNEDVNITNIERFVPIIREEILNQYPDIKIREYSTDNRYLSNEEIIYLKEWYKTNNGKTINIKSIKKGYTKTLKMQG